MRKALIQLNTAVFLWGFTGVLGRAITLDSVFLVWYRLLITVISLWLLYAVLKKIKKLPVKSAFLIGLIGTVQAIHWVTFYGSIKYANVTIALTCLSTAALLSSVIEPILLPSCGYFSNWAYNISAVAAASTSALCAFSKDLLQ